MKNNIYFTGFYLVMGILFCCVTGCNTKEKQTSDRTMYNLAGEVSSCKLTSFSYKMENGEIVEETDTTTSMYKFSKEGRLSQLDDGTPLEYDRNGVFIPNEEVDSLIRNKEGQLIRIVYKEDEYDNTENYSFEYNKNGTLSFQGFYTAFSRWENTYIYNAEGQIIEELCVDGYDGLRRENKFIYEYKKIDKHGNWVSRVARDDTNEPIFYEEREIEYYGEVK